MTGVRRTGAKSAPTTAKIERLTTRPDGPNAKKKRRAVKRAQGQGVLASTREISHRPVELSGPPTTKALAEPRAESGRGLGRGPASGRVRDREENNSWVYAQLQGLPMKVQDAVVEHCYSRHPQERNGALIEIGAWLTERVGWDAKTRVMKQFRAAPDAQAKVMILKEIATKHGGGRAKHELSEIETIGFMSEAKKFVKLARGESKGKHVISQLNSLAERRLGISNYYETQVKPKLDRATNPEERFEVLRQAYFQVRQIRFDLH